MKKTYKKVLDLTIVSIIILNILMLLSCSENHESGGEKNLPQKTTKIDGYTDLEIINKVLETLALEDAYYVETTGETAAKCVINYTQTTNTGVYFKDNKFYNDIASNSSLVNHTHQLLVDGSRVYYYDSDKKDEGLIREDLENYRKVYGVVPSHDGVFHYVISENNIISSKRSFTENELMITYTLKPDQSTENIRKQMKVFGGLVEEPTYESVELTIYIDEAFKLLSFRNNEKYKIVKKVPLLGKTTMNCTQTLYSKIYYTGYDEPDISMFNDLKTIN